MKLSTQVFTLGALVAFAAAGAGSAKAADLRDSTSNRYTLHFAGSGEHTLEVRTITGHITVEAYDGKDVEVLVDRTIDADSRMQREQADREVKLETSDNTDRIQLIVRRRDEPTCGEKSTTGWRHWDEHDYNVSYDFTIRVPKNTRLELCTINDGDIVVSGTRGDFSLRSVNGRITMDDVGGSGEAKTVNGRVTATFATAPREASAFKTVNGDVVLEMPDRLAADLRMKTFNGGLFTDFEVEPLQQPMNVSMRRQNGRFVYRSNGFTSVRAGGGGPELTLQTLNGDVRVLRRTH
jgi:hypothetical protein